MKSYIIAGTIFLLLAIMIIWGWLDNTNWQMIHKVVRLDHANSKQEDEWYNKTNQVIRRQRLTRLLSRIIVLLLVVLSIVCAC